KYLGWPLNAPATAQLPRMLTDIMLTKPDGTEVIVDAKFTSMATRNRSDTGYTLASGHLYQIQSYVLAHAAALAEGGEIRPVSGATNHAALASPGSTFNPHHQFRILGHDFSFAALDLTGRASTVRDGALAALGVDIPATPPSVQAALASGFSGFTS